MYKVSADSSIFSPFILTINSDIKKKNEILPYLLTKLPFTSVILYTETNDEISFQKNITDLIPLIQSFNTAALVADHTRVAGRTSADGIYLEKNLDQYEILKQKDKNIIGIGNMTSRHQSLEWGEKQPDFIFFGKLNHDNKPKAHARNIALSEWWAELIEIPCVIQAGNHPDSLAAAAKTGADFIAIENMLFDNPIESIIEVCQKFLQNYKDIY
ncbi:thiamine phosphate synthase [Bartonella sp. DGB1]|uniref:thiamine phosphate synthase n=1 Tax=Bartonella sp. DGB1 TaxID=3239807 RepID=UPI003523874E